jgi:hypothetical protein
VTKQTKAEPPALKNGHWDMKTLPCATRVWRRDLPKMCLPAQMVQFNGKEWLAYFPGLAVTADNSLVTVRIEPRWIPLSQCLPGSVYTRSQRRLIRSALQKLGDCSAPLTIPEVKALEFSVAKIQAITQPEN